MITDWEREWKARQSLLDAAHVEVPNLLAAVLLWKQANRREDAPDLNDLLGWLLSHVATLESDLVDARLVCDGFARRIAAQSELFSKRAEAVPNDYRRRFLIVLRKLILAGPETPLDAAVRREEWVRTGNCVCPVCRELYADHPNDPMERSLVVLCDRTRVKL
jgi:hypothetical protein